jgi:hypothetical protein
MYLTATLTYLKKTSFRALRWKVSKIKINFEDKV